MFLLRRRRSGSTGGPFGRVARGPYYFIGPRPFREARLGSYIIEEHRRGPLDEILADPYLTRRQCAVYAPTPSPRWGSTCAYL